MYQYYRGGKYKINELIKHTGLPIPFKDNRNYFDYDCIVEHFMTTDNGAFAFIANSRYGWGDPYGTNGASQFFDREFFDAIFKEGITEIGRANQDSKEDNIGFLSQDYVRWCYYQINLFGDPTASISSQANDFAPVLTSESISSTQGYQDTPLNFNVVYTDIDNNGPCYINLVINDTEIPMKKQDLDDNYTDGCIYQCTIYMQSAITNYSWNIECNDGEFYCSTSHDKLQYVSFWWLL